MNLQNEVIWSELAQDTYIQFLKYLLDNNFSNAAIVFDEKVESLIERLQQFKELCPPSNKIKQFRKCVINAQVSLVYRTSDNMIEIVAFIDNRSKHDY
jgi:plasmid stabilization system protein ParE